MDSSTLPGAPARKPILQRFKHAVTTKDGLIGQYDYAALFRPNIPFIRRKGARTSSPFFGLHDRMPVLLSALLGFQHALAMLAGVITPPILLSGQGGANLSTEEQQYLVSTALIVSGILSAVQITRFHIYKTPYGPLHLGWAKLTRQILHRNGSPLSGRSLVHNHSHRPRRSLSDVRQRLLPFH